MTVDARAGGLDGRARSSSPLEHRATGRDLARLRPPRPPAARHPARLRPAGASTTAACGCRSSAGSSAVAQPERAPGRRDRARRRPLERARSAASARTCAPARTTGVLKLVGIPVVRALADALALGRAARRALGERAQPARHASGTGAEGVRARRARAARRAPRSRRGRRPARALRSSRDGDAGGRGLERAGRRARFEFREPSHGTRHAGCAIGALAGLTLLGERRSLGALIERTPVLRDLDRARKAAA